MRERRRAFDEEGEIVEIAEPPVLSGFVGLDYRVVLVGEVGGSVAVGRVVATADMTARHAHPEVHPAPADAQAVLAALAAGRHIGDLVEVTAGGVGHCVLPSDSANRFSLTRSSWGRSGRQGSCRDVRRSCGGRLLGRYGLNVELDAGRLSDQQAAGLQRHVPRQPEVLPVDVGRRAEADALVPQRGDAGAVEVDLQADLPGGVAYGQIADELPRGVRLSRHCRGPEGDRRVALDVEEVRAPEVGVTVGVPRVETGCADLHLDMRVLWLLADGDLPAHVA